MDINSTLLNNDLVEIAEKAGATFRKAGHELRSACPLHHGGNRDAFAVYTDEHGKQKWRCFSGPCGGGDIYDFVQAWQNTDFVGAYQYLGGETNPDPGEIARAAEIREQRARVAKEEKEREHNRALQDLQTARLWEAYHHNLNERTRELWRGRGVIDSYQDYWCLGYNPEFVINWEGGRHCTPTLTIPIQSTPGEVINIRHRLLNPPTPNDKYRPDRPGLQSAPFIAYTQLGFETDPILVVEGEIKSMITFQTIYRDGVTTQVIGIPGKTQFRSLVDRLQGHDCYICFDPDADEQALEAARAVKGKIITLPMKIDDAILAGALDRRSLQLRMKSARKV
jgi:hypothetical protein